MNSLFTAYQCPWGSSAPLLRLPLILGLTVSTSPTPLFHHQTMGIQQWAPFTWHKAQKDSSECVVAYCNWRGGCYHHPLSFGMAHPASEHQHPDWQEIKVMLQGNEMLWCYHERQVIREPSLPIMRHPLPPWGKWEMSSEVFQLIQPFITAKKTLPEPPTWYVILKDIYPGKPFSINPGCVSCLKPHARFHTQDWQRELLLAPGLGSWLLTHYYIRTKQSKKTIWRNLSCLPARLLSNSFPFSFLVPTKTHLLTPGPGTSVPSATDLPSAHTLQTPWVPPTSNHTPSLACPLRGRT